MLLDHANTSWGNPQHEIDTRVQRKYQRFLARVARVGEFALFIVLALFLGTTVWLFTQTNLENIIFYDGTGITCVLDGSTQEIFYAR